MCGFIDRLLQMRKRYEWTQEFVNKGKRPETNFIIRKSHDDEDWRDSVGTSASPLGILGGMGNPLLGLVGRGGIGGGILSFGCIAGKAWGEGRETVLPDGETIGVSISGMGKGTGSSDLSGGGGGGRFGGGGRSPTEGNVGTDFLDGAADALRRFSPTRLMTDLSSWITSPPGPHPS